jgi:hypothetical protein
VQPNYDVQSRVSIDSFRIFVGAIVGIEADIPDGNARDLELVSDELKFTTLSTAVADWQAARLSLDADPRLITASPSKRLQSHDQTLCLLDRRVDRLQQTAIKGERPKVTKAEKDIDLVVKQRQALAPRMCELEGEIGDLREAIAGSRAKLKENFVSIQPQVNRSLRQSLPRLLQAVADVRNVVERLGAQLQAIVEENSCQMLAVVETRRANEQLAAEEIFIS